MDEAARTEFVCPSCTATLPVSEAVRRTLIEVGCVYCGAPVSPESFTGG